MVSIPGWYRLCCPGQGQFLGLHPREWPRWNSTHSRFQLEKSLHVLLPIPFHRKAADETLLNLRLKYFSLVWLPRPMLHSPLPGSCQDCETKIGFVCFLNSLGLRGLGYHSIVLEAFLGARMVQNLGSIPRSGRSPREGNGLPTPVSLPEKSHGQRSLVGYSPWGCKELDTTERRTLTHFQ